MKYAISLFDSVLLAGAAHAAEMGDLPGLYVAADGTASNPVLAPRLPMADVGKHALRIRAGGDNHSDHPAALGGGGARVACGGINGM